MSLDYVLERDNGGKWVPLWRYASPQRPSEFGLVGVGQQRLRWRYKRNDGNPITVEIWQWDERIPLNPGDIQCTDFAPGWKLIERKPVIPTPQSEEMAHTFLNWFPLTQG